MSKKPTKPSIEKKEFDLDAFLEEFSAVYNKPILSEFYCTAIEQPSSFLFVDLPQHDKRKMFYINSDQALNINQNYYDFLLLDKPTN
jgi:hypothetical protein